MRDYILKRLLLVPLTLFGISLITFIVIQLAPGDPAEMKVRPGVGGEQKADQNVNKETYERTREQFDLDKPLIMQYVRWVGRLCGIKVEVWGAKKDYREKVDQLLIERFQAGSADEIAAKRQEIEQQVAAAQPQERRQAEANLDAARLKGAKQRDLARLEELLRRVNDPAERAEKAAKQLEDWVAGKAKQQRFKYSAEIDALRQDYRAKYGGDAWEAYFRYSGLALNRKKDADGNPAGWYPMDFGRSFKDDREVLTVLMEKIPRSLELSLISIFLAYMIAIPLGIHSSVSQGTVTDQVVTTTLFILYSLPSFWVGIMLLLLVSEGGRFLPLFPVGGLWPDRAGTLTFWEKLSDPTLVMQHLRHLALPVFCLTYASFAYISRQMRAGMLEVIRRDYIRTARAKGLPEHVVIFKHALRNSLIPIITIVAVILPALVGGSVIIETIFNVDGIGRLSFTAILTRDYPIIMAVFTLSALLTLLGILLSDILYAVVDPQISFEGK
ncbi:MAG: ABC transporter permease subunit [Planctomycetota bacterium]